MNQGDKGYFKKTITGFVEALRAWIFVATVQPFVKLLDLLFRSYTAFRLAPKSITLVEQKLRNDIYIVGTGTRQLHRGRAARVVIAELLHN